MAGHEGHAMAAASASTAPAAPAWSPFPPARRAALERLVDLVIPADDTRGAKDAGVATFIEMMHGAWMNADEQRRCDAELDLAIAAFAAAGTGDPVPLLYDVERFRAPTLRKLTVYGYYTSEVGASEELDLNLVPGAYDACAAFGTDVRAPSLNVWGIGLDLSTGAGG